LRRLFLRHLGASPRAVAQTRRLHFAKKLIDETCLPMTQIAIAAGFGSVRRFNACIHKTYQRTPTQIRERAAQRPHAQPENQYLFNLDFRPPYAWHDMLAALRADATQGIEVVDADGYRRSISLNGAPGHLHVTLDDAERALQVRVKIDEPRLLFLIIEKVRGIFDLNSDWPIIEGALRCDPALAARMRSHPGLRVAGCFSGFELAVRAILGQPHAPARAATLAAGLVAALGARVDYPGGLTHLFPSAETLAEARLEDAGIPAPQALALRTLARAVSHGHIGFEKVADPQGLLRRLAAMPGFSAAALEYIAMRALREPDAFPLEPGTAARLLNLETSEVQRRLSALRPWRAYAAAYLSAELR
jgi:AraC family transcriptional regulator, regulatory protein of adaptative response / DNA-3-methyladenine glycosylase II